MKIRLRVGNDRTLDMELGEVLDLARQCIEKGKENDARHLTKAIISGPKLNKSISHNGQMLSLVEDLVDNFDDKEFIEFIVEHHSFNEDFSGAIHKLDALAERYPANSFIAFSRGYLLASLDRRDEAHRSFSKAGELNRGLASSKDISNLCSPIRLPPFKNKPARELNKSYSQSIPLGDNYFSGGSLLSKVQAASIEISNICNYSNIHVRCPTRHYTEKTILPSGIVLKALEEFGAAGFAGSINWGLYTEPLIDPRLIDFIKEARRLAPQAKNTVTTNGFYLTQESAEALIEAGLDILFVSAYSTAEYVRFLTKLDVAIPYYVYISILTKRVEQNWYGKQPLKNPGRPKCFPFLLNLSITCQGEVGLCCNDWNHMHTFGSLRSNSLTAIISSQALQDAHARLGKGDRPLHICQRCPASFSSYPFWLLDG